MRECNVYKVETLQRCAFALTLLCLVGWSAHEAETWQIRSEDPSGERLLVTVAAAEPVREAVSNGVAIAFPGQATDRQPGAPDIRGLVQTIPGRPGFHAVIRVIDTEYHDEPDVTVAPAESTTRVYVDDNVYKLDTVHLPDQVIYGSDAFWPPALIQLDEASMGTNKYVRIVCWPAQYNPVNRVLRLHERIEAELRFIRDGEPQQVIK